MEEFGGRDGWILLMFRGVLAKVTVQPLFCSSSIAKAKKGMIWSCAMKGNITIFSFLCSIMAGRDGRVRDTFTEWSARFLFMVEDFGNGELPHALRNFPHLE